MIEQSISIGSISPIEFFGVNNDKLDIIRELFPTTGISARGDIIRIKGEKSDVDFCASKLKQIIEHVNEYNIITKSNIKRIILENNKRVFNSENKENIILFGNSGKVIKAKTKNQHKFVKKAANNDLIFALGPAGSGKTYTAIALAVKALKEREIKKIILSRPAVEAGESLGFLPGDMKDKIDPYLQPLYDALLDMIPSKKLQEYLDDKIIEIAPLAYMRGRTLNNAFVILDEAQNTTKSQLKMFLTRMGIGTKYFITGDMTQVDLPKAQQSGLVQAFKILKNIKGIEMIEFDNEDIVRHPLVKKIVTAYRKRYRIQKKL